MSEALAKVNDSIKSLAGNIEAAISFDDDGAATLPETFVKDNLPEGLSIDLVKQVQDTEANFATALALGLGNSSLPLMAKNKSVDRTTAHLVFGNDVLRASVDRTMTVRIPGSNEEKVKHGVTSVKLESGAVAKRGDLKRVIGHIGDNFAAKFDK